MANNNDFRVLLQAVLDSNSIGQDDINKIQKVISKYHLNLTADLDKASVIAEIKKIVPQLEAELKKMTGVDIQINDNALIKAFNQIEKQAESTAQKINKIQLSMDTEKYSTQIFKLQQEMQKFGAESGEAFTKADKSIEQMNAAYNGMKTSSGNDRLEYEKEYQKALTTTNNLLSQLKSVKENELLGTGDYRRSNFVAQLNNYLLKNTAMTEQSRQKILQWIATLDSADDITRGTFDNIKKDFKSLDVELRKTGQLGLSTTDKIKQAWEKFGGWSLATSIFMGGIRACKDMTKAVYEIDTAMTELAKVSDTTGIRLGQSLNKSIETAKKYGAAVNDIVSATADWSRLGYDMDSAENLAKVAAIYRNVGDGIDIDTANKSLVSTLQGFQLDADKALEIIDKFNEVGVLAS